MNNEKFPKIKKNINNFLFDEEGNIPRSKILTIGTMMLLLGIVFTQQVYAKHSSHKSHSSHSSHSSGDYGGHSSHESHSSHSSHSSAEHSSHSSAEHSSHSSAEHSSHSSHSSATHSSAPVTQPPTENPIIDKAISPLTPVSNADIDFETPDFVIPAVGETPIFPK